MASEYSTDLLMRAAERLTDADSFAHGLRLLTSNYNLLQDNDALVVSWTDAEKGVIEEAFATSYAQELFPTGLTRPLENTAVDFFLKRGPAAVQDDEFQLAISNGNVDFERYRRLSVQSVVGIPIVWRLQTIGLVQLLRIEPSDPVHVDFLERLAVLLAPYLALVRSSMADRSTRELQAALSDLAGLIAEGTSLEDLLKSVTAHVKNLIGFDSIKIRMTSQIPGQTEIVLQEGAVDISLLGGSDPDRVSRLINRVAKSNDTAFGLSADGLAPNTDDERVLSEFLEQVPSALIAPMKNSRGFVGTIEIYSFNEWAYGASDIEIISKLSDFALHGISQSQLVDGLNHQLEVRKSLTELARISAVGSDTKSVLTGICSELVNLVEFDHLTFYLPDMLLSPIDGLHTNVGSTSFSAIPYSKVEGLDIDEIESVTAHLAIESEPKHTAVSELWNHSNGDAAYVALSRDDVLSKTDLSTFHEAARHIAPAFRNLLLYLRDAQLVEEQKRAEQAESSATQFQEIDRLKKEILSTVTHELRTPLTSMIAFIDILLRNQTSNLTEGQIQNLNVVRRGALSVSNIVGDLDELTTLQPSELELNREDVSLDDIVRNLARDLRPLLEPGSYLLRQTLPHREVVANVDRIRITQVLSNLISNAAKYSPEGSMIRVLLRTSGENAHFFVKDQGQGIPLEEQESVFGLFTRANTESNASVKGTGVGLYVCKKIVEAHGGQINLHSEIGDSTTVHFWIPLDQKADD